MIKNVVLSIMSLLLLGTASLKGQTCTNDTIFSDVLFVIDNSGSIDNAEFAAFSDIIKATVNKVQGACPDAQVGVVHYGGNFGQETFIEYPLSTSNVINTIDRQFCDSLNMFGFCAGGGGDDLNYAMGELITYFGNGSLNHNTANNLSIVIFTDAFDGSPTCGQPNCSILRPFTNIDMLKSNYEASVTVVGASMQANASLLQIYASPGGNYDLVNLDSDCSTTYDGCVQPRKYIPIEFNSDVNVTSDSVAACVSCKIQVVSGMMVDAGNMQMICGDLSQSATLTAVGSVGVQPYSYSWSMGAGNSATVSVTPSATTTYYVTATDVLNCSHVDSVTVIVQDCCTNFSVNAGSDMTICGGTGETATLVATASGSGMSSNYIWDNGLGAGQSHVVMPASTTIYSVTASDYNGCMASDQVTVSVDNFCAPNCDPDTTFTDIIFLVDNSGSIDDSEFTAFENIILTSLNGLKTSCPSSRRSVVHYGGFEGTSTFVEYSLGQVTDITVINRQYCTARNGSGFCIGGGGDDLNHAIGDIMTFLGDGTLNRDPDNNLALVILTDAFGFDTTCPQPNCSLILPTTNIDQMKANYGVDVSVVGISSQAEEVLLGIYASPGGTFNSPLYAPECAGSFDGCQLPRKYVQIEFNTPPQDVSDMITSFVECTVEIVPVLVIDAGPDTSICNNFGGPVTLTVEVDSTTGLQPYIYQWSNGLGNTPSVNVMPATTTTYYVTATDANDCSTVDSATVNSIFCDVCLADAGTPLPPNEVCLDNGQAFLASESNTGVVLPPGYEEVFILTNSDLVIIDYSIGFRNFQVNEEGLYRIHTLVAEVTNPSSPDYFDINIIKPNQSELFIIVNCIENHGICADFDFPGRVHLVFGPMDMMCMTFENSINLCMDGIDNDGDGLVDCADDECKELINCVENTLLACNDLTDNDGDGLVDCFDSDCFGFTLCFERGDNCNDGIDNDGDGLVDCADSSCDGSSPCLENSAFTCIDGRDNDGDGLTDCQEASCQKYIVCAESSESACSDGIDNDFNGLIDCEDIKCKEILGEICNPDETTNDKCSDGLDNDGDGLIDCADPDCRTNELLEVENNIGLLIEIQGATCPDNDNGSIRFVGIANNPNFQYSIDGGENFISSSLFTGLDVGPYDLAIKSMLGCIFYVSADVTGQGCIEICNNGIDDDSDGLTDCQDSQCNTMDPYNPQIVNIIPATCPGFNNGSFSISGVPFGVLYSIDGVNFQSLPKFSSLAARAYNLSYKDQFGCYTGPQIIIPKANDDDNDGVCNAQDRCPGLDDDLIGTPCDDGDPCTVNDTYSADCNCQGLFQDADGDGVCDVDDICPNADDTLIGTTCDDGDPCTINDLYSSACNCAGTFQDSDSDGICDANDQCPNGDDSLAGTLCDDGDSCTINDVYNNDCQCAGTFEDTDNDGICDAEDLCPLLPVCIEDCFNGIDDDGDGLIDCDDGDCDISEAANFIINSSSCPDNNNGVIEVLPSNDSISYSLDGINFTSDPVFIGLQPGSYIMYFKNNSDCITDTPIEVGGEICREICGNGTDDDSDGLVDCEDDDCCGDNKCEHSLVEFEAVGNTCATANGRIHITNYDTTVQYILEPFGFFDPFTGIYDSLAQGTYRLEAIGVCGEVALHEIVIAPEESCEEICNNGLDDDNDGLIDCDDNDCTQEDIFIKLDDSLGADATLWHSAEGQDWKYGDSVFLISSNEPEIPNLDSASFHDIIINYPIDDFLNSNSTLDSAWLSLYSLSNSSGSGNNEFLTWSTYLITEPWDESSVVWSTQPTYSEEVSITVTPSTFESVNINVTSLLQKVIKENLPYYGFYIERTGSADNYIVLGSREAANQGLTPEISLVFSVECSQGNTPNIGASETAALNIQVMLQGACAPDGGPMNTELNKGGYLPGQEPETFFGTATPAGQPFNQAPWFYEGDEGKNLKSNNKSNHALYEPEVVDWVLVSLRTEASKPSEVWRAAGLLYNDGTISLFDPIDIKDGGNVGYFVVVEHRNHLPVMSHGKVQIIDGLISYDFTKQDSYTSIIGIGQIQDEYDRYMMVAGNGELIVELSSDIDINARDLTQWLQNNGANSSYFLEDYDMNGDINIKDRILWEKNNGLFTILQTK